MSRFRRDFLLGILLPYNTRHKKFLKSYRNYWRLQRLPQVYGPMQLEWLGCGFKVQNLICRICRFFKYFLLNSRVKTCLVLCFFWLHHLLKLVYEKQKKTLQRSFLLLSLCSKFIGSSAKVVVFFFSFVGASFLFCLNLLKWIHEMVVNKFSIFLFEATFAFLHHQLLPKDLSPGQPRLWAN